MKVTAEMVEAGAKALRERLQSGKRLNAWETLPNTTKLKWRAHANTVLQATANAATME